MNLLKSKIKINCPECDFENEVTLDQVSKEEEIICIGCLKTIKLIDKDKTTKTVAEDVNKTLNDLKKLFK